MAMDIFTELLQLHSLLSARSRRLVDFPVVLSQTILLHSESLAPSASVPSRQWSISSSLLYFRQTDVSVSSTVSFRPSYSYTENFHVLDFQCSLWHLFQNTIVPSEPRSCRFPLHHHNAARNCSSHHQKKQTCPLQILSGLYFHISLTL